MIFINYILYVVTNLDKYLEILVNTFGNFSYLIIFFLIFSETGFIITPIVPADSVLFATGVLAAMDSLNIYVLTITIYISTVLADTCNYYVGRFFGDRILKKEKTIFIKKEHIKKASAYYDKYGVVTILMSRFIPLVKTFVPFSAGLAKMNTYKFTLCNLIGAAIWLLLFLGGGFLIGGYELVQEKLFYVVIIAKLIVLIPGAIVLIVEKKNNK